ncbi:hypothetical protein BU26DRAFT_383588, partial [Trematosphaeria pertusa]
LYTLPIYFQSITNVSAEQSGIRSIPLILGISLFTIVSNTSMSAGVPWVVWLAASPLLTTAGFACLHLIDTASPLPKALGYQALTGVGIGVVLQMPMAANQKLVAASDIAAVTGMTLFFEILGA